MTLAETPTQSINHLLFKWLYAMNNGNEKAAELRFTAYYKELVGQNNKAGPLLRHVEQLLRRDTRLNADAGILAQDLIQTLVLYHFNYVTWERRKADKRIRRLAPKLKLVARGDLFQRQIKNWSDNVVNWADESINFPENSCELPDPCQQEAKDINLSWLSLRKDGEELLKWLYSDQFEDINDAELNVLSGEPVDLDTVDDNDAQALIRQAIKIRLKTLCLLYKTKGETAADEAAGFLGGSRFALYTWAIINASSRVRIPMVAMLYWKSGNLVRDYFKSKAAKFKTNCESDRDDDGVRAQSSNWFDDRDNKENEEAIEKTDSQLEEFVLWSDVTTLLYQPVSAAEQALSEARTPRECRLAEEALIKQYNLYDFNVAVIGLWHEGVSEQGIAAQLDTTRDKVRTRMAHISRLLAPLKSRGD